MKKFGFLGAGKMAGAIVEGLLASGFASPSDIHCLSSDDGTGEALSKKTGIALANSADELLAHSDTVVLAIKPQQLNDIPELASKNKIPLLISILAGTSIERLRKKFPNALQIVRVMPNMPAQILEAMSCYASESELSLDDEKNLLGVLDCIGESLKVQESQLDAVTAISGSGPGYVFEFAAALIEAAKKLGFAEQDAKTLVYKTMVGSAKLLTSSSLSAVELRNCVSSPGGTTLAGLAIFEKNNLRQVVADATNAAKNRSEELSKL